MFQFHGGGVSWASKRLRATAISTIDTEFYAASEGARDAIWFKSVLAELGIDTGTIPMYCDSNCAFSIIQDPEEHQRVKHIDVKYFFHPGRHVDVRPPYSIPQLTPDSSHPEIMSPQI
jgi:hypothetical protein